MKIMRIKYAYRGKNYAKLYRLFKALSTLRQCGQGFKLTFLTRKVQLFSLLMN